MYSSTLSISTQKDSSPFEYVRWHTINYILRQGEIVIRSPLALGRNRPECHEPEFATVCGEDKMYSFRVDKAGPQRSITIFVCSPQSKVLEEAVSQLTKNSALTLKE